jgi:ParB family chromosome partitioning protein
MTKMALGKGFEGLIPTGFDIADVATPSEQIKLVAIKKVYPNDEQPRKYFDENALRELADSIKTHGIIQPLVVTPQGEKFRIVAGERRYRASLLAGLEKIPVIVRNHKELEELEIALVENVQRVDLSPLEQAVSIVRLRDQFSLSPKQIAKKLGKAETTISNIVRLLQLPPEAIKALQKNIISEGHARTLLALKVDASAQLELLKNIETKSLSVRDAEEWVKKWKQRNEQNNSSISPSTTALIEKLSKKGMALKLRQKKRGGQVILDYKNEADLQALLQKL